MTTNDVANPKATDQATDRATDRAEAAPGPTNDGPGEGMSWTNHAWSQAEPGRLMGRGHRAGDLLEAWKWTVLEQGDGLLVVEAHLPDQVKNPRGQLFGGFTPTYVDLISLFTVHSKDREDGRDRRFLSTINMRCDYFEPVMGPTFVLRGELENQRGKTSLVSTKFFDGDTMLVHAITTLRSN